MGLLKRILYGVAGLCFVNAAVGILCAQGWTGLPLALICLAIAPVTYWADKRIDWDI